MIWAQRKLEHVEIVKVFHSNTRDIFSHRYIRNGSAIFLKQNVDITLMDIFFTTPYISTSKRTNLPVIGIIIDDFRKLQFFLLL